MTQQQSDQLLENHWCGECRDERLFETPPCVDGHDDCPERICTVCGYAFLVAVIPTEPTPVGRRSHAA